jgi:hypothetical protein
MLNERQYVAACDKQANKKSPARRSGLMVKSEKEIYGREENLSVVCLRKSVVVRKKAKS